MNAYLRCMNCVGAAMWMVVFGLTATPAAHGQAPATERELDFDGEWVITDRPQIGSTAAVLAQAREAFANGDLDDAERTVTEFIETNPDDPLLAEAFLLRGDIKVERGNPYDALYDYEAVARGFPESSAFNRALEREYEIAVIFANGRKRRILGVPWFYAYREAEELLILIQERVPGSRLAQRAGRTLGDFYFTRREMDSAVIAYDAYLSNHRRAGDRPEAMKRLVFSYLATARGPTFDPAGLYNAREWLNRLEVRYPLEAEKLGAVALRARIDESDAQRMLSDAEWYIQRSDPVSAQFLLKRVIKRYPQTASAQTAVDVLVDRGWMELADLDDGLEGNSIDGDVFVSEPEIDSTVPLLPDEPVVSEPVAEDVVTEEAVPVTTDSGSNGPPTTPGVREIIDNE